VEKYGRARKATDDNIIQRITIVCWITNATYTHSEYIILVLPWEQWLHEHTLMLTLGMPSLTCVLMMGTFFPKKCLLITMTLLSVKFCKTGYCVLDFVNFWGRCGHGGVSCVEYKTKWLLCCIHKLL
jgi:hypothetical protein